ncbi:MAG: beta-ketoacyl synthase [Victivallaceae bacterium]|nr:beta-ketoacyl-[acyl-carrier-protein] synthase family protein [Victivallaceae bacterium]
MRKVFITGRGLVTPIGVGLTENEASLRNGVCGIERIQEWVDWGVESEIAGTVPDFPAPEIISRKMMRFCPPTAVMSVAATAEAFAEAKLPVEEIPHSKIAVLTGVAGSYLPDGYANRDEYVKTRKMRCVSPCVVPRVMPSCCASNLSLIFGIKGETYDISAACASSLICIVAAVRLIQSGLYDMVVAGGAEGLDWSQALGFTAMRALSTHYNGTPHLASRPFDRDRDGFVLASGAGYVLLESEESMRRRGISPVVEVTGVASNSNATDMVIPDASASEAVMRATLANAGLSASDVSYVNTHGTATPIGDPVEIESIKRVFGSRIAVNSTKSNTGHMVGATGAVEVIFTTMMQEKGFISKSLNLDNVDPACDGVDFVRELRTGVKLRHALSNAFAFGGSNASIIMTRE